MTVGAQRRLVLLANRVLEKSGWRLLPVHAESEAVAQPMAGSGAARRSSGACEQPNSSLVISVSLWGNDRRYVEGALRLADDAARLYPGWCVQVFAGSSVPEVALEQLTARGNCCVIQVDEEEGPHALLWRFRAVHSEGVEAVIFRDTDSRLSPRERAAVDAWLASPNEVHVMRDHLHHSLAILGGMWGVRGSGITRTANHLATWSPASRWFADTDFLRERVYSDTSLRIFVHQDQHWFADTRPVISRTFKVSPYSQGDFVGRGLEFDGSPRWDHNAG